MNANNKLNLDTLTCTLSQSLQIGIILCDRHLTITDYSPAIEAFVDLQPTLDLTLACGTDANVWENWTDALNACLQSGRPANFGIVKYTRDDRSRMFEIRCIPIPDRQPEQFLGGAMLLIDVTDKLESEHEMASAQRLIAIGKVAGKVAHELNNPLDGILRYVNLTLRILDQGQPQKAKEYLTHCRTGLQRMAQIITEMLEFSRSATQAVENSPLDKLLDDAIRAMESSLRQIDVRIVRDHAPLPHMKSDSLFQVFCNLIKNACDAMDGAGILTVTIARHEDDCMVEFADTGRGFDPDDTDEMFRPFFTTKPRGRGTGLGLAICKDILEKLGGSIQARNNPGGGATFTVHLPCPPLPKTAKQTQT